ncbi:hypothetical protein MNBD_GAMMA14-1053 [hydrothermal vent metagenome]|uniref:Glycosyltransferase 2-like domain-containing protein n=1 Tax=hydrothermal vent metagenome TaxID=652676 RepID=A0A3B0YYY8_9ZZZZ
MHTSQDLTICTVSFNSGYWLDLNYSLAKRLNPHSGFTWLVAENSPKDSSLRIDSSDERFNSITGAEFKQRPYASASYHHGEGLNILINKVHTRYLLVLDPDFFIVRKNWINDIIEYINRHKIAILGTPWHPKRTSKIRYFPSAHCTFFDLEKVNKADLDFLPDYDNADTWLKGKKTNRSRTGSLLDKISFAKRRRIGTSRDTGWIIYDKLKNSSLKIESFQAVYHPKKRRLLDKLLPDRLSLIPKRKDYFRTSGSSTSHFDKMSDLGWEEFFWQSTLFGFHVRCYPKRSGEEIPIEDHYKKVKEVLVEVEESR